MGLKDGPPECVFLRWQFFVRIGTFFRNSLGSRMETLLECVKNKTGDLGSKARVFHKELRCLYVNTQSLRNKFEVPVYEGRYDIVAIIETWWDETHDWNVLLEGYNFKKKQTPALRKEEVKLHYM